MKLKIVSLFAILSLAVQSTHAAVGIYLVSDIYKNAESMSNTRLVVESTLGLSFSWWGTLAALGGEPVAWVVLNSPETQYSSIESLMLAQFPELENDLEAAQALIDAALANKKAQIESFAAGQDKQESLSLNLSIANDQLEEILEASYFQPNFKQELLVAFASE